MTEHLKTIEQTYKVLDELQHVRQRLSMYAGSSVPTTCEEHIFDMEQKHMVRKELTYIPAVVKIVSEAIDNCVDMHKRDPKKLDKIRLSYDLATGEISIEDNCGIPVEIHKEIGKYVPEIIFGQLRSGSNYDDNEDQAIIGTNGLGVKLLNICSSNFLIETGDGKQTFKQEFSNGMRNRSEPKIKTSTLGFTRLTFTLDYEYLGLPGLNQDHIDKIVRRLVDVAGTNPGLKVYVNGERIAVTSFEDYVKLYTEEAVFEATDNWSIAVAPLFEHADGFQHVSFVNGVETYEGGTHVNYVIDQITTKLREFFKKKHKVEVKPADIRGQMTLFISANINRPKFNSQTKALMISEYKDYKTSYEVSDKFIKKLMTSPIIQSVLDWVLAKQAALERAELRKLNKNADKNDPRKVEKFADASEKRDRDKCLLFLTEGDSAGKVIQSTRDPKFMGVYPLRGKPLNVSGLEMAKIIANAELKNLMTIMGLQLGEKVEEADDGDWVELLIDDEKVIANINDKILVDGDYISVRDLIKP